MGQFEQDNNDAKFSFGFKWTNRGFSPLENFAPASCTCMPMHALFKNLNSYSPRRDLLCFNTNLRDLTNQANYNRKWRKPAVIAMSKAIKNCHRSQPEKCCLMCIILVSKLGGLERLTAFVRGWWMRLLEEKFGFGICIVFAHTSFSQFFYPSSSLLLSALSLNRKSLSRFGGRPARALFVAMMKWKCKFSYGYKFLTSSKSKCDITSRFILIFSIFGYKVLFLNFTIQNIFK